MLSTARRRLMRCERCGFDNPAGFRFCGRCGKKMVSDADQRRAVSLAREANRHLAKHLDDMKGCSPSERARLSRAFESKTGMPVKEAKARMQRLERHLRGVEFDRAASVKAPVKELAEYYDHLRARVHEKEKDPEKRKEALRFAGKCGSTAIELAGLAATILA